MFLIGCAVGGGEASVGFVHAAAASDTSLVQSSPTVGDLACVSNPSVIFGGGNGPNHARETGGKRFGAFVVCSGRCGVTAALCNSFSFLGPERFSSDPAVSHTSPRCSLCV